MITQNDNQLILENDILKVLINPSLGGKIRSLISKATGTEFLYHDSRAEFDNRDYSARDVSGFDECFPTVGPCDLVRKSGEKVALADHGFLWQKAWDFNIAGDRLIMNYDVPEIGCSFERICSLSEPNCLRLDYKISNYGDESLPYIYSSHLLLNGISNSRIELPSEVSRLYNYIASKNTGMADKGWVELPLSDPKDLTGPYSLDKKWSAKFFTEALKQNSVSYHNLQSRESLRVAFDNKSLPYLGILICQGYDDVEGGHFSNEFLIGLEPTTGIGDELDTCRETQTLSQIPAGGDVCFWVSLSLDSANQ